MANGSTAEPVVRARVREPPACFPVTAGDGQRAAAHAALEEAGQQVLRVDSVQGATPEPAVVRSEVDRLRSLQALLDVAPEPVGYDAQLGRGRAKPVVLGALLVLLQAPLIALPALVPDDLAAVERPVKDFADRAGGPGPRPAGAAGRGSDRTDAIQDVGDLPVAGAGGGHLKNADDHVRELVEAAVLHGSRDKSGERDPPG